MLWTVALQAVISLPTRSTVSLLAVPVVSAVQGTLTAWAATKALDSRSLAAFTSFWAVGITLSVVLFAGLEMAGLRHYATIKQHQMHLRYVALAAPFALLLLFLLSIVVAISGGGMRFYHPLITLVFLGQLVFLGIRVILIDSELFGVLSLLHVIQVVPMSAYIFVVVVNGVVTVSLSLCLIFQAIGWAFSTLLGRIAVSFLRRREVIEGFVEEGDLGEPDKRGCWNRDTQDSDSGCNELRPSRRRDNVLRSQANKTAFAFAVLTIAEATPFTLPLLQGSEQGRDNELVAFFALYVIFARGVTTLVNSQAPRFTKQIGRAAYESNVAGNAYKAASMTFYSIWRRVGSVAVGAHLVAGAVLLPVLLYGTNARVRDAALLAVCLGFGEVLVLRTSLLRITLGMVAPQRGLLTVAGKVLGISLPMVVVTTQFKLPFMVEFVLVPYSLISIYSLLLGRHRSRLVRGREIRIDVK